MNGYQIIGLVALCVVVAFGGAVVRSLFAYGEDLRDLRGAVPPPRQNPYRSKDLYPGDVIEGYFTGARWTINHRTSDDAGWYFVDQRDSIRDVLLDMIWFDLVERGEAP